MRRTIATFTLPLVATLALTACGGGDGARGGTSEIDKGTTEAPSVTQEATPAPAPAPAPAPSQGSDDTGKTVVRDDDDDRDDDADDRNDHDDDGDDRDDHDDDNDD